MEPAVVGQAEVVRVRRPAPGDVTAVGPTVGAMAARRRRWARLPCRRLRAAGRDPFAG